jgi:hypothetical protein
MKKAIECAIEGGYDEKKRLTALGVLKSIHEMLLDPLFWRSLGKQQGWKSVTIGGVEQIKGSNNWWSKWHDLIDHIADGKSIDSFFEQLLK